MGPKEEEEEEEEEDLRNQSVFTGAHNAHNNVYICT
jgi:hypothetical protein